MSVELKVVAGGVAAVSVGGISGVAIQKGLESAKKASNSKKQKVINAIEKAEFTLKEERSEDCQEKLQKGLEGQDYIAAVVACVVENSFESKAEKIGFTLLYKNKVEDSSEAWTTKWNKQERKDEIKSLKNGSGADWTKISQAASEIQTFCNKGKEKITVQTTTEEWHKFLKICIKECISLDQHLKKDFWTGK